MYPIRIGMVGLGIMGRRYYRLLQDIEGGVVTALCVRHLDTMQDLTGTKFADYRLLCASGQVNTILRGQYTPGPDPGGDGIGAAMSRQQAPAKRRGG